MTISGIGQSMSMQSMFGMQPPSASNMASQIMGDLDTDGDGVLSTDEISKGGERAQKILGADADGDGYVTEDELLADISKKTAGMNGMHPPSASNIASHIMDKLDTNGDGVLSTDEINAGGKRSQNILEADTNGDGKVTMDELLADISKKIASISNFLTVQSEQTDKNSNVNVLA
jgi:Ca2+-binding EF-hand superfamily protein